MSEVEKKETVDFRDIVYAAATIIALVAALIVYSFDGLTVAISMLVGLLGFAFAVTNDAVETAKPLFKYSSMKGLATVFASLVTTFALIKTYQDINLIVGIDPSLLGFTSSIVFIIKLVSLSTFYIGIAFFIFMILASSFLPLLLIPLGIKKEKTTSNWVKFRWFSRAVSIFAVYVLGSVLSPERPHNQALIHNVVYSLALYADFNTKHYCTNEDLTNKPVIFLQKGYVLTTKGTTFEISECY